MDPVSALVATLAAGATAGLKEAAGDAVKSAYHSLKTLLEGRLSSLPNLEDDPEDPDYQAATRKEVDKKGLVKSPEIVAKARELIETIERDHQERHRPNDIDITQIHAAGDVLIRSLEALEGGVHVRDVTAEKGKIEIEGIRSGAPTKN